MNRDETISLFRRIWLAMMGILLAMQMMLLHQFWSGTAFGVVIIGLAVLIPGKWTNRVRGNKMQWLLLGGILFVIGTSQLVSVLQGRSHMPLAGQTACINLLWGVLCALFYRKAPVVSASERLTTLEVYPKE